MTLDRQELRTSLIEWLEACRDAYAETAKALGLGMSVPVVVPVSHVRENGSVEGRREERFVSPTASAWVRWDLENHLGKGTVLPASPSRRLFETYGDKCRLWSPLANIEFSKDPEAWIDRVLFWPLANEYIAKLASLENGDPTLAKLLADGMLELIEGDEITFVTSLPLAGLDFESDPFRQGVCSVASHLKSSGQ